MSYAIPLIDGDGSFQNFGGEFNQIYQLELKGNLQIPNEPVIDYNTGSKYTLYDNTGGIFNQEKLFENNDDPNEDQQITSQQAMERLKNNGGVNRQLSESEKRYNLYTNDNFDIRFRNQLVEESIKKNDNLFSEFSQDHVKAIRTSNANYFKEDNLYQTPETMQSELFNKLTAPDKQSRGIADIGIDTLMNMVRKEQKTQEEGQAFRDRQMPKYEPTMTDRYREMIRGKPSVRP